MNELSRILAIDPGDKRIGIAISDPTQTIASPIMILKHISRDIDAQSIIQIAKENQVGLIIIGQALNWDGKVSAQGNKSRKLAEEICRVGTIPVKLWDEFGSTETARLSRVQMNMPRKKRRGHHDDIAAVIILQTYLDAKTGLEET